MDTTTDDIPPQAARLAQNYGPWPVAESTLGRVLGNTGMVQKSRFSGNMGGRLPGLDERGSQDRRHDHWRQFRVKRV
jgi:hypothetical protein